MVHVKICGIRRPADALAAVAYGADAVGVLVGRRHRSPDFLDASDAVAIVAALPPHVASVLVTHLTNRTRSSRSRRRSV